MEISRSLSTLRTTALGKSVIEVLLGSCLLALSAQVSIQVPLSPVPFTLQTAALFLLSAILGPKKAFCAVLAYLAEGALGLPVFAQGMGGAAVLIGPRAGYLAGFALATLVAGGLASETKSFVRLSLSFATSLLVIYTLGFSWLSLFMAPADAFALGVVPFLFGDVMKVLAAAALVKGLRK